LRSSIIVIVIASLALPVLASAQDVPTTAPRNVAGLDTSRMLGKKFWIIETHGVPGTNPAPEMMRKHLERQIALEKSGILFAAGPVMGGELPYGMIVVRAASREDAQKIADGDPLHAARLRTYVLREWQINEGRMSVKLNFSDGTYNFE
jgi:uncharacterized protein